MLSQDETIALNRLRRKGHLWERFRWLCLVAGLGNVGLGIWLVIDIFDKAASATGWDGGIVWLCPICWGVFVQGVFVCATIVVKWRGDATTILLLKLFEDEQK